MDLIMKNIFAMLLLSAFAAFAQPYPVSVRTTNGTSFGLTLSGTSTAAVVRATTIYSTTPGNTNRLTMYAPGTGQFTNVPPGTAGQILTSDGTGLYYPSNAPSSNDPRLTNSAAGLHSTSNTFNAVNFAGSTASISNLIVGSRANTVELRSGTTPQGMRIYNSYTDASNNEWLQLYFTSNEAYVQSAKDGSGTARPLNLLASDSLKLGAGGVGGAWTIGVSAQPFSGAGSIRAGLTSFFTNGIVSLSSNLIASTSIAVGASPFNWTNTIGKNVFVYVDGVTVTGTIAKNGTNIFSNINGQTVPLQINQYLTITYTVGTPTARFDPW